jgi:hypothetical protein
MEAVISWSANALNPVLSLGFVVPQRQNAFADNVRLRRWYQGSSGKRPSRAGLVARETHTDLYYPWRCNGVSDQSVRGVRGRVRTEAG